jgi:hypothetical protein
MKKEILIFIPCFNVSKHIFNTFYNIPFKEINKLAKISYLFIEDHSSDQTYLEIKKLKDNYLFRKINNKIIIIKNKINLGYGGVQKLAYNYCKKKNIDFCIMLHGDGQYNPKYLPKFIKFLLKFDKANNNKRITSNEKKFLGVFGSRMINWKKAIEGNMPIYKFLGNKFLTCIQNFLLSTSMSEFHSGYRSYNIKNLNMINFNKLSNKFDFDTQIIIEAVKKNFLIKEFSINTFYGNQVSHLKSIPYGFSVLRSCLKYFFYKNFRKVY